MLSSTFSTLTIIASAPLARRGRICYPQTPMPMIFSSTYQHSFFLNGYTRQKSGLVSLAQETKRLQKSIRSFFCRLNRYQGTYTEYVVRYIISSRGMAIQEVLGKPNFNYLYDRRQRLQQILAYRARFLYLTSIPLYLQHRLIHNSLYRILLGTREYKCSGSQIA